jgi:hypothetical protein
LRVAFRWRASIGLASVAAFVLGPALGTGCSTTKSDSATEDGGGPGQFRFDAATCCDAGAAFDSSEADRGNHSDGGSDSSCGPLSSSDDGGSSSSVPVTTEAPIICGTAQVGQTLMASTGLWSSAPATFFYQWNRAGLPIPGAASSTYVVVAADTAKTLTVVVDARNAVGFSAPAQSAATASVSP